MNIKKLQNGTPMKVIGVHDAITAQLASKHGFDGLWVGGFGVSTTYGVPDANILTLTELIKTASIITSSVTDIPVIVDCDSGFGGYENVARTVKEMEQIGVSAICIEDKPFPKINSFAPVKQVLIDPIQFGNMIKVATESRKSSEFLIIARIESFIVGENIFDALKRAYIYEASGADAILIHSKKENADEIISFSKEWKGSIPLIIVPTTYPQLTIDEIEKLGNIEMVIYANQLVRKYITSTNEILSSLINADSLEYLENQIATINEVFELQGLNKMLDREKKITNVIDNEKCKVLV